MSGANSLLETGNMGFGMRAVLHPIASFPFPGKRGHCFLGRFFRLVLSYSLVQKESEWRHVSLRTAVPRMRTDLGKPAPLHLRRLFLPPGNCLRLRRAENAD